MTLRRVFLVLAALVAMLEIFGAAGAASAGPLMGEPQSATAAPVHAEIDYPYDSQGQAATREQSTTGRGQSTPDLTGDSTYDAVDRWSSDAPARQSPLTPLAISTYDGGVGFAEVAQAGGTSPEQASDVVGALSSLRPSGVAAETAGESGQYLYRGVHSTHPGFEDALNGVARPRGGPATAYEHNALNDTRSEFTSWTTDPEVAEGFQGGSGVILRIPHAPGSGYSLVKSPDVFDESEVLVRGTVTGAERRR